LQFTLAHITNPIKPDCSGKPGMQRSEMRTWNKKRDEHLKKATESAFLLKIKRLKVDALNLATCSTFDYILNYQQHLLKKSFLLKKKFLPLQSLNREQRR